MISKLPKPSEHAIMNAIIDILRYEGYMVWRNNVGAAPYENKYGQKKWVRFGKPGFSDVFGVQSGTGKFIALEIKTAARKNSATPEQLDFIEEVKKHGGIGAVVSSPEEVIALLNLRTLI